MARWTGRDVMCSSSGRDSWPEVGTGTLTTASAMRESAVRQGRTKAGRLVMGRFRKMR